MAVTTIIVCNSENALPDNANAKSIEASAARVPSASMSRCGILANIFCQQTNKRTQVNPRVPVKRDENDGMLQRSRGICRQLKERKPKSNPTDNKPQSPPRGLQTHKPGSGFLRSSVPEFAGRKLQALRPTSAVDNRTQPTTGLIATPSRLFPFRLWLVKGSVSFHHSIHAVAVGQVVRWARLRLFLHRSTLHLASLFFFFFFLAST